MDFEYFNIVQWYGFAFIIAILNYFIRAFSHNNKKIMVAGAVITAIVVSIFASWRTGIGDTGTYVNIFYRISPNPLQVMASRTRNIDWGFYTIMSLVKLLFGNNSKAFLLIFALLTYLPLFYYFAKLTGKFDFCFLIYLLSGNFIASMNGMRQALAATWFIVCIYLFIKHRYVLSLVFCLLLSTIHQSALILIPVLLMMNSAPWGRSNRYLIAFFALLYFAYPLFNGLILSLIQETRYSVYIEAFSGSGHAANILRALVSSVPLVLGYIKKNENTEDYFCEPSVLCAILNTGFMFIATIRSWILARFCIYFLPLSIVLLCNSIDKFKNKRLLYLLSIFFYSIYFGFEVGLF